MDTANFKLDGEITTISKQAQVIDDVVALIDDSGVYYNKTNVKALLKLIMFPRDNTPIRFRNLYDLFMAEIPHHITYADAYLVAHEKFQQKYGRKMYKNYRSFRSILNNYAKQ